MLRSSLSAVAPAGVPLSTVRRRPKRRHFLRAAKLELGAAPGRFASRPKGRSAPVPAASPTTTGPVAMPMRTDKSSVEEARDDAGQAAEAAGAA